MALNDVKVKGISAGAREFRVAASATRYYFGDPAMVVPTYSSGAINTNTVTVVTDSKPTVATDNFIGVFAKSAPTLPATLAAAKTQVIVPIPYVTILRCAAKTAANINTDAKLLAILGDLVQFGLTTGTYTIIETATTNAAGLIVANGDVIRGTLDVTVDARAMRTVIS